MIGKRNSVKFLSNKFQSAQRCVNWVFFGDRTDNCRNEIDLRSPESLKTYFTLSPIFLDLLGCISDVWIDYIKADRPTEIQYNVNFMKAVKILRLVAEFQPF